MKESLWIFSNATNKATTLQIMKLCELKVLECFCRFLEAEDPKLIEIALDGLTHIFACGDRMAKDTRSENIYLIEFERHNALQIVEKLQQHPNYSVYTKALFILETFYDIEEPI